MLTYLGPVGFGIWAVVRVLMNYASLSDLGLTNAITKFVAEKRLDTDRRQVILLLRSAFLMYLLITVLLWLAFFLLKDLIISAFFTGIGGFRDDLDIVLFGSLSVLSINLLFSVITSAFNGMQRMDITNGVTSLYWVLNGSLMYVALVTGYGLRGLVYANIIATVVTQVINFFMYFRLIGHAGRREPLVRISEIAKLFRYGKHIFIGAIANSVYIHYDKLLLSSFLGLAPVASYEVASRVIQQMRQIPILIFNPLLPATSEMEARNDREGIVKYYCISSKYLIAFLVPLFGIIGLFADSLIRLWLGEGNDLAIITLQIFVVSNFLNLLTAPGYFVTLGIGKPQYSMYTSVVGLVSNLILSYIFLRIFGYFGVVTGTVIALTGSSLLFLVMIHKVLNIRWKTYFRYFLIPLVSIVAGGLAGLFVSAQVGNLLFGTASALLLSLIIYSILLWKLDYFTSEDKQFFSEFIKKIREKIFPSVRTEST